ncbi:polyphosphate kinase 2 family protein [Parafrigoribacterium mesophilum]|uniref:PPK2 family polyphosphate kinase n=1 Tax=Parafrigoribacterium mesophilum TaxID=433646 RepID=UPI0031FD6F24
MTGGPWTASPSETLKVERGFSLPHLDPSATPGFTGGKEAGRAELKAHADELAALQEKLYAQSKADGRHSVLLVLQGMDTSGKGGVIEHVVGAISPSGVRVASFGKPTREELAHDFLWRVRKQLPRPGIVGVFDRSHYEDVLVARVRNLAEPAVIRQRYGQIVEFERELTDSGTVIVKVMLHVGAGEQKKRLADRLNQPDKHWKYNPEDLDARAAWGAYREAYQLALERTSTDHAPWFVVPANHKWYARLAVQALLLDALRGLHLSWPSAQFDVEAEKRRLAAG